VSKGSIAHGWAPIGSQHIRLALLPGESREVIFLLGYHENPVDAKFDPPDSQIINKTTVRPIIQHYLQKENVEEAFAAFRRVLDRNAGCAAGEYAGSAYQPHGEYLECLPVHDHF
jgi:cellobiose phosphorylase